MDKQNEALTTLLHLLSKIENDAIKARAMIQKLYGDQGVNIMEAAAPKASTDTAEENENIKVVE